MVVGLGPADISGNPLVIKRKAIAVLAEMILFLSVIICCFPFCSVFCFLFLFFYGRSSAGVPRQRIHSFCRRRTRTQGDLVENLTSKSCYRLGRRRHSVKSRD